MKGKLSFIQRRETWEQEVDTVLYKKIPLYRIRLCCKSRFGSWGLIPKIDMLGGKSSIGGPEIFRGDLTLEDTMFKDVFDLLS